MPKMKNCLDVEVEVDPVRPTLEDWNLLATAQIFCPDDTWRQCPYKDVCKEGNEQTWIECPTVFSLTPALGLIQ